MAGTEGTDGHSDKTGESGRHQCRGQLLKLKVKWVREQRLVEVEIPSESTVAELKDVLREKCTEILEADSSDRFLRLIYRGLALNDSKTLSNYSISQNDKIFVTGETLGQHPNSAPRAASQQQLSLQPNGSIPACPAFPSLLSNQGSVGQQRYQNPPLPNPFASFGFDEGVVSPEMAEGMLQSPMVQAMLDRPDFMQMIIDSNPQLRQLREKIPEVNHILNDPQVLRDSIDAVRNPDIMREMIRNTDRAMSNIESTPGGFNALRRMYHTIQEPMWAATVAGPKGAGNEDASSKEARYDLKTDGDVNAEALPNPWDSRRGVVSQSSAANPLVGSGSNFLRPNRTHTSASGVADQSSQQRRLLGIQHPNNPNSISSSQSINVPVIAGAASDDDDLYDVAPGIIAQPSTGPRHTRLTTATTPQIPSQTNANRNSAGAPVRSTCGSVVQPETSQQQQQQQVGASSTAPSPSSYASQLETLAAMGFTDTEHCLAALRRSEGNINRAIDGLLTGAQSSPEGEPGSGGPSDAAHPETQ